MAVAALGGAVDPLQAEMSLHLWLPMRGIDAERVAARALTAGVRLTTPDAFAVSDGKAPGGLRLCLGAAPNRATLARALQILKNALAGRADDHAHASL
jgi:DNA-binding transcriptional MocR family regulator